MKCAFIGKRVDKSNSGPRWVLVLFFHVTNVLIKLKHETKFMFQSTSLCVLPLISSEQGLLHHDITNICVLRLIHALFSLPVKSSSHTAQNHQDRGNPWRGIETEGEEKENIFAAMCRGSKTWQSHDQRHLIILELHCFFNPSERTVFYWGWGVGATMSGWQTGLKKQ